MWVKARVLLLFLGAAFLFYVSGLWAETIELVTYYPASATAGNARVNSLVVAPAGEWAGVTPADGTAVVFDRLGVGTNAPAGPLHVVGVDDAVSNILFLRGADTGAAGLPDLRVGVGITNPSHALHVVDTLAASWRAAVLATQTGNNVGGMSFAGWFRAAGPANEKIGIRAEATGATRNAAIWVPPDQGGISVGYGNALTGIVNGTPPNNGMIVAGNVGIGTNAPASPLHVVGADDAASNVLFMPGADDPAVAGVPAIRVGIGLTNPSERLEVNGNIEFPETAVTGGVPTGVIMKAGGVRFLHDYGAYSTFLGEEAGNFTMTVTGPDQAFYNTGIGRWTLRSLTTGGRNTALGAYALTDNTSGRNNVAVGGDVLRQNTSGERNVGVGDIALLRSTTGDANTAVGTEALRNNTTGRNNTAIGTNAGNSNTTGSGNVFIGYNAGWRATGSNQLYIDNSDTLEPLIYGDFSADIVTVNGTFNATTKNFEIPHPSRPGHRLVHSTLEGPEAAVFYRGEGRLVEGRAEIRLPDYFEALARKQDRTVQLTAQGPEPYPLSCEGIVDGKATVHGTKPDGAFYWEVKAVRADVKPLVAERETSPMAAR